MARRRAGTAARGAKARSRPVQGAVPEPDTRRIGATGRPTGNRAGGSGAVEPEALVVTQWFDSGEEGEPYSATVRSTGRRVGIHGALKPGDTFVREETIARVVPGSGPVSITTWVYGLKPGEWAVNADLIRPTGHADGPGPSHRRSTVGAEPLSRAAWSWRRWALFTAPAGPLKTRWALPAPLARIPAVIPGSLPVLAAAGVLVALVIQAAILADEGVPIAPSLVVSLLAIASGLIGAKLWSLALHPGESLVGPGWAVDGFLVVAPVAAVTALLVFGLPIGMYLDATAPGLFFAVAIGRVGCFFTGCCAGRCTSSRWGVWSSDRRVGARRIPTQLLESASGLLIGVAAAALVVGNMPAPPGAVFVGALAAYFAVRQLLLRLRAESRRYSWRRNRLVIRDRS